MHAAKTLLALLALASAALCAHPARALDEWTFMVYMDGDNNLESAAISDFMELAAVGSSASVNVVMLFDRIPGESSSYGNWTDTRMGRVDRFDEPNASWGASMGELNMGNPLTVRQFVDFSMMMYPAERYAFVFWNHGSGWRTLALGGEEPDLPMKSVCADDTDDDRLDMSEVREALAAIETDHGEIDLVGFDACIMGMVEVAYEIREHAGVMVGSEMLVPNSGWPYTTIMQDLVATPTMSAATLGGVIVDRYCENYGSYVMSSVSLHSAAMGAFKDKVNHFARTLRHDWNVRRGACAAAAQDLLVTVRDAVLDDYPLNTSTHGLAVYFPEAAGDMSPDYTNSVIQFTVDTEWDEFLVDFHATMGGTWVAAARDQTQEFDIHSGNPPWDGHHVDLWDFCEEIIERANDTLWVDFSYAGYENGGYWTPYSTVAEAVTAAAAGNTICIKGGTSAETPTITKAVYLEAAGGKVTIGH